MRRIIFGVLLSIITMNLYATPSRGCGIDRISESNMRLGNYWGSQTGTSIFINCDHGYNIKFLSQNLRTSQGDSYLTHAVNPKYRIHTRMSVNGGGISNVWGQNISGQAGTKVKYSIAVQLEDRLSRNLPAGQYEDRIWINLNF
ncbi:hypothetical protein [Acinetobacter sp. WCHAc060025]|uniref:hypothetical protein n=1 Tax=Acinetobacter sp. WCHAc060025 TaxID=2518625 RepID=UPI001022E31E|nr:hypothetical protein [Acinetobacter sp. WCHAc060025]RZG74489.1 hypothetical protein EXE09_12990 [Acinetobacter sp. WCHAc060025]